MPSCQSCSVKAVDARLIEVESRKPLIFLYPDQLSQVPANQLPVGKHSIALQPSDIKGLSSLDLAMGPKLFALDASLEIIAQADTTESFASFRSRVEK